VPAAYSGWDANCNGSNKNDVFGRDSSVPSEQQRRTAEEIARGQAKGYTITNQLTIAQK
jgi:hypothetical protein